MHDIDYRLVRDHDGDVVGQFRDHWVTDRQDAIVGFVFGTGLYALDGTHVGWHVDGRILDLDGGVVATVQTMPAHAAGFPLFAAAKRPKVPKLRPRKPRCAPTGTVERAFASLFLPAEATLDTDYTVLLAGRSAAANARPR